MCAEDFYPQLFGGMLLDPTGGKKKKTPMNYSKRGPDEARLRVLALHDKSRRWLFKEHSCVKFNY